MTTTGRPSISLLDMAPRHEKVEGGPCRRAIFGSGSAGWCSGPSISRTACPDGGHTGIDTGTCSCRVARACDERQG